MPKVFTSKTQKTGELGEKIALEYLKNKGFSIIERNFTCKVGEIDIIAYKQKTYYFIEVKSVTQETLDKYNWKPEQNFHTQKFEKMLKTVQIYRHKNSEVGNIELLLVTVVLDQTTQKARVSLETIQ